MFLSKCEIQIILHLIGSYTRALSYHGYMINATISNNSAGKQQRPLRVADTLVYFLPFSTREIFFL